MREFLFAALGALVGAGVGRVFGPRGALENCNATEQSVAEPTITAEALSFRQINTRLSPLVFGLEIEIPLGHGKLNLECGTAFHIGDGYFATAKHVVKSLLPNAAPAGQLMQFTNERYKHFQVEKIADDVEIVEIHSPSILSESTLLKFKHPKGRSAQLIESFRSLDIVILKTSFNPDPYARFVHNLEADARVPWELTCIPIPPFREFIVSKYNDLLRPVLCIGYPPILELPQVTPYCLLTNIAAVGVDTEFFQNFVISGMGRKGMSGAPVFSETGELLGIICKSAPAAGRVQDMPIEEWGHLLAYSPLVLELLKLELKLTPISDKLMRDFLAWCNAPTAD